MPNSNESVTLKSRSGHTRPITPAQIAALQTVFAGDVFERRGHLMPQLLGIRADVYEVLERNALVEVLDDAENAQARWTRHRVVLTDRGREILEALDAPSDQRYSAELHEAVGQITDLWSSIGAFRFARLHRYPAGSEAIWAFLRAEHDAFTEEWLGFPIVQIIGDRS